MAVDKRQVDLKEPIQKEGRSKKFDIRWTEAEQDLILQASALKKSTATSFIRENALAAAESIVCEQQPGERRLLHALRRAALLSAEAAIRAVVVDAFDGNAKQFYASFDFVPWPLDGLRMWILMKDLQKTLRVK